MSYYILIKISRFKGLKYIHLFYTLKFRPPMMNTFFMLIANVSSQNVGELKM